MALDEDIAIINLIAATKETKDRDSRADDRADDYDAGGRFDMDFDRDFGADDFGF